MFKVTKYYKTYLYLTEGLENVKLYEGRISFSAEWIMIETRKLLKTFPQQNFNDILLATDENFFTKPMVENNR